MRTAPAFLAMLLGALAALVPATPAHSISAGATIDDTVLARVDDETVTVGDLLILLSEQRRPEPGAEVAGITADGVLSRLVQNRLMEQEGFRMGLDTAPEVKSQVDDLIRHRAMIALLDSLQATVPEPEPETTVPAAPLTSTMLRVSHILVTEKAEALALRDSLDAGTPFAALAERRSLDTEWSTANGDLGWSREDKFIPEFAAGLEGLSEGDVSDPVRTAKGWHLLKITETHVETLANAESMAEATRRREMTQRVMETIEGFVDSLKVKYHVTENDSLLATLDYASESREVLLALQDSREVLAVLPWREVTVADLTRQLRFEHFHGLQGKPNAAELRDTAFHDWIKEMLLRHEAVALGFQKKPLVQWQADRLRRERMREIVGREILDVKFQPEDKDVERYYRDHKDAFTSAPRVRAEGVFLRDEASATRFRQRLEAGAQLGWLADRTKEVTERSPALFADWMEPSDLGAKDVPERGAITGPFQAGGSWAVARVVEVQAGQVVPLERCRPRVLGRMKSELLEETMRKALGRLEDQAKIRMEDNAVELAQQHINRWARAEVTGTGATGTQP
ncbi:peptidyl-prolyl cis-trans isomerase [bacterium]|nr:peptidyl-prolyl cis-trans isomerase [bacterium]